MIKDDASGFAIDLAPPNAVVCVIEPASQFDADACKGIDPAPVRAAIAKGQTAQKRALAIATVHRDGFSYDVNVLRQSYARASSMTPQQLEGFARAAAKGVGDSIHQSVTAKAFDGGKPSARETAGMNTLSIVLAPDTADASPIRVVAWSFFADDAIVTVSYVTDANHLDIVRTDSERIASTIDWPAARASHDKRSFAKPPDAVWWPQVLFLIAAPFFAWWLWTLIRRRRPLGRSLHAEIAKRRDDEQPPGA